MTTFRCPQCDSTMDPSADDGRITSPILCDRCEGRRSLPPIPLFNARFEKIHFQLTALFTITTLICVFLGAVQLLGLTGAIIYADVIVLAIGIANVRGIRTAFGVRIPKITMIEFFVLLAICIWYHGIQMPAVMSSGYRRNAPFAPAPVSAPAAGSTLPPDTARNAAAVNNADEGKK